MRYSYAVAVKVYEDYKKATGDETKTLIASTASPYKFSASVLEAIEGKKSDLDEYDMVARLAELSDIPVPSALADLKNKERRFTGSIEKSDMNSCVMKDFGLA